MNMTEKFAASLVAVTAFSAIIFASASADSLKPAQSAAVVEPAPASGPLNSNETPQEQLKDLQYN